MKNKYKLVIVLTIVFFCLVFASQTEAADKVGFAPQCDRFTGDRSCTLCDFIDLFIKIAKWGYGFLGLILLFFVINGGFRLMTAAGNPESVAAGKKTLGGALIGAIVVLCSWLIVGTVIDFMTGNVGTGESGRLANNLWWKINCDPCDYGVGAPCYHPKDNSKYKEDCFNYVCKKEENSDVPTCSEMTACDYWSVQAMSGYETPDGITSHHTCVTIPDVENGCYTDPPAEYGVCQVGTQIPGYCPEEDITICCVPITN